jgi:hypothetical protein
MHSTRSWAKDYGKRRYDVTVEEVDLFRLLAERGAAPEIAAKITTWDVQMIMDHEANCFMHWSLAREEGEPKEAHQATAMAHIAARDKILDKYAPRPAKPEPARAAP